MNKKQKLGPSEKIIQVYVKVSDIIRTEYEGEIDIIYQNRETRLIPDNVFSIEGLVKDVEEKGILDALKIKADGTVMRGNTRCEVADIKNIEYLPIDLGFFIGLFHGDKQHITTIRKIIYEHEIDTMNTGCRPVKPPTTKEYRKKVGRTPGDKDYLINWSDEFVLLQSHFAQKEVPEKQDVTNNFIAKKSKSFLTKIINHWMYCEADPTEEENCKWCHQLYNIAIGFEKEK